MAENQRKDYFIFLISQGGYMALYIISHEGYHFVRFADFPGFGNRPQWSPDLENAKTFDSEAQAQECLEDSRFGDFRKRCEIHII